MLPRRCGNSCTTCRSSGHIVGFSPGGAVGLEIARQRLEHVPSVALINSLATYRPDAWRKWLETVVSAAMVRVLGIPRAAYIVAAGLFPLPWQKRMRAGRVWRARPARGAQEPGAVSELAWSGVSIIQAEGGGNGLLD
jgi:pimeloyl-ACP methyl ester carboxylesterase